MDQQLTGPSLMVKFPFNLSGEMQVKVDFGKIEDNKITFQKELAKNDHLYYPSLLGYSSNVKDYDLSIENHKTGAAVRITSDQPLAKLVFWSAIKTLCPEPYIHIRIQPGETFSWNIYYQFYICDTIN
jgi:hypothetical protein